MIEQRLERIKNIDRKILGTVNNVLINLEQLAELREYKDHIISRQKSIKRLFQEFEVITFEVDRKKELLKPKKMKSNEDSYQYQLDRIIKRKISNELENFYNRISVSSINDQLAILTQLTDRKLRLEDLFDKYYLYVEYLENTDPEL